jgi:hypothetical protein
MFNKIEGFSNYLVEDTGKIFSLSKKDYMNSYENNCGYEFVSIKSDEGKWVSVYIHRLVAKSFLENPNNHPNVLHLDDNPKNNNLNNLKWGTQSENISLCSLHGRISKNNQYIKNPITWKMKDPFGNIHITQNLKEFCHNNNLCSSAMRCVLKGLQGRKQHKGWTRA